MAVLRHNIFQFLCDKSKDMRCECLVVQQKIEPTTINSLYRNNYNSGDKKQHTKKILSASFKF